MNKKVFILKTLFDNLIVSIAMSITASILSNTWDIYTIITIFLGYIISLFFTLVFPMEKVEFWFGGLFKIKRNTLLSELIGGLFTNIILTTVVSFSCKILVFKGDLKMALDVFLSTFVTMYIVSYIVYQLTNNLTIKVALYLSKK
jgi:hypothetical protein